MLLMCPQYSWRAMQQLTQRLIRRLSALGQYEEAVAALNAAASERPAALKTKQQTSQHSDIMSICDDPFIVAQQLTHIELVRRRQPFTSTPEVSRKEHICSLCSGLSCYSM